MPATSEMISRLPCSSSPSQSAKPAAEYVSNGCTGGDWRGLCDSGWKTSVDRYFVRPAPSRLIATPETMWLTPNVTVAIACSRPPSEPNTTAATTAAHGPHW